MTHARLVGMRTTETNWKVTVGIFGKRGKLTTEVWSVLGKNATEARDRAMSDLDKPWYKAPRGMVKAVEAAT